MIFRTSASEEKHNSVQSHSTHNDDITLLEDQERHLEAVPSLTGKYVNKTARTWVEARVDWRLQWFGAIVIYLVVVLAAYFASYRHQYNSIILTTLNQNAAIPSGAQGSTIRLPQILLLTQPGPSPQANFTPSGLGVTQSLYSAQNGDISWCDMLPIEPQQVPAGPCAYLVPLQTCILNSSSENILINVNFSDPGPPPQLMIGAFPPERSTESVMSFILSSGGPQYLTYLPTNPAAQMSITPSILISLRGDVTPSYDLDIQWMAGRPPDDGHHTPPALSVTNSDITTTYDSPPTSTRSLSPSATTDGGNPNSSTSLDPAKKSSGLFVGPRTSTSMSTSSSATPGGELDTETSPTTTVTPPSPSNPPPSPGPSGDPNNPGGDPNRRPGGGGGNSPGGPGGHRGGRGEPSKWHPSRRRGPPLSPDHKVMSILINYKYLNQTVQSETRRMSGADIFFNCVALLSVLLLSAEIIGRVGSWWIRRRMSKRFHLD